MRFVPALSNPTALFICSALAIIPVAGWIGRATEELAFRVGEELGGLLNASLGNAAELIIAGIALCKGYIPVVKASITGSIIGNILLVLGLSILLGGTKYKEQEFNRTGARTTVISLSLAAIALIIPPCPKSSPWSHPFTSCSRSTATAKQTGSRACSCSQTI